ncbi:MAG TPA: CHAD domain-containing protein [Rhizomicrobium sp.]|nr:CHAD domain-containing protein [Rhizomicrobium sp.]
MRAAARGSQAPAPFTFRQAMTQQYEFELHTPMLTGVAGTDTRLARNVPALIPKEPGSAHPLLKPRVQKAQPSLLPPEAIALDAFRLTLVQCRWHIAANVAAAVETREVEALHQLRVALRRLRVALASFGGEFRTPELEAIKLRAKSLTNLLAPARDLDVFTRELLEPAANANGAHDAFAVLRTRAQTARAKAWSDAVVVIAGPRFRMFMADLADIVDRGALALVHGRGASKRVSAFEAPAQRVAERMLAYRQRQACKKARRLEALSVADRHELRIRLKKLRYTSEFFAPFFDRARMEKFIARLSRMQDILGALNDVAVAKKTLDTLISENTLGDGHAGSDLSFAAGIVYGWHLERAAHTWRDAVKRWKKFAGTREFWTAGAAQ